MAEKQATAPAVEAEKANWPLGVVAAIGLALVGAIVYAAVAVYTDNEIGYLALLIGLGAGWGLVKFGKVQNIAAGVIAAVVAFAGLLFALLLAVSWLYANEGLGNLFSNLGDLFPESFDLFKFWLEEDAIGYLFVGLAVVPAFLLGAGFINKKDA